MNKVLKPVIILIIKYFLLVMYAIISIYPLIWLLFFFYSFKSNNEIFYSNPFGIPFKFMYDNYVRAWNAFNMILYFKNSVVVTVMTVFFTIFFALLFSYATSRMRWKLSTPVRLYISVGMFIPVQVILIPIVLLIRDFHLTNSYISLVLPYVAFQLGFSTMAFHGFLRSIPFEFEEAAAIDGANIYRTFISIIVPMVKPAIASVCIFILLFAWNEFSVALVMINNEALKTLPLGLINFRGQFKTDWGAVGASLVIASLPTIILYLFFSETVEKALTVGAAIKG